MLTPLGIFTSFSACPLEHGCLAGVNVCLQPIFFTHVRNTPLINGVPLSVTKLEAHVPC